MRVAIADDSALFRDGLVALMGAAGVEVTCAAADGTRLLAAVDRDPPHAVVLDIRMPPTGDTEGLRVAEAINEKHPDVGILLLSAHSETVYAVRLLECRSSGVGYLLKDHVDDVETLRDALRRVCRNESVIDPDIVTRLFAHRSVLKQVDVLTGREQEVLRLMAEGLSNVGIGKELHLSARTVEAYIAGVFTKLQLPAHSEANRRVLAVLTWMRTAGTRS